MANKKFAATILAFAALITSLEAALINTEQRLITHILQNYSKESRPVLKQSSPTNVTFGIELVQLINVNDRYQTITTKIWVRQNWKNQLMRWEPKEWNNVQSVQIDGKALWTPDIVLYNNAESSFSGGTDKYKTRINLNADGSHSWLSPAAFTSTCSIDITYFPFDRQVCLLKFGSWAYDASGIDMLPDPRSVITTNYINSSEWEVVEGSSKRNSLKYACCPFPYTDITITIILKRKPLYYLFNVISPCLVLAMTILFGFFLPPESGERISLTITILLAVAVFLQLVSDNLPRNSDSVPILAIFYMVIMAESALSLITTCAVLTCHFRASARGIHRPPDWVRKLFFNYVSKFIRVGQLRKSKIEAKGRQNIEAKHRQNMNNMNMYCNDGFAETYTIPLELSSLDARQRTPTLKPTTRNGLNRNGVQHKGSSFKESNSTKLDDAELNKKGSLDVLDDILKEVQVISNNFRHVQSNEENQDEWKLLSIILDRLFFWIFLLTLSLSSLGTLLPVYLKYN